MQSSVAGEADDHGIGKWSLSMLAYIAQMIALR